MFPLVTTNSHQWHGANWFAVDLKFGDLNAHASVTSLQATGDLLLVASESWGRVYNQDTHRSAWSQLEKRPHVEVLTC